MNVGEVSLDIIFSESSLAKAELNLTNRISRLNLRLNPIVNHEPLNSLNAHLDKKVAHLRQVNQIFKTEPITPFGNVRQLDRIERLVNESKKLNQAQAFKTPTFKTANYQSELVNFEREISNGIKRGIRQGVRQGFRDAGRGNLAGGLFNVATAPIRGIASSIGSVAQLPVKLVQKSIENVLIGTFQGFGQQTASRFAQGFYQKSGGAIEKIGQNSARYADVRTKQWTRSAANTFNYRSTSEFTTDLKAVASSVDMFVNPVKLNKLADNITETIAFLYDKAIIQNNPKEALKDITINPLKSVGLQSVGKLQNFVNLVSGSPKEFKKAYVANAKERKVQGLPGLSAEEFIESQKPKREFQLAGLAAKAVSVVPNFKTRVANYGALREIDEKSKKITLPDLSQSKGVTLTTGGFQLQKGKGSREIANQVKMLFPENDIIPIDNTYTDRKPTETHSELLKFLEKFGYKPEASQLFTFQNFEKLLGTSFKGSNPDAVKIAATVKAIKTKYPNLPVGATTFSGGTYPLEQAIDYTTRMGYKDVKGVGTGAGLYGMSGRYNPNYQAVIGKQDPLTFPFQLVKPSANTSVVKNFSDSAGMDVHAPKYYFSNPVVQQQLAKLPGFESQEGIDKTAQQEIIFLEGRRAKINRYIKRVNKFFQNPLSVPENKVNEAFSEFGDVLFKQKAYFATGAGEGLKSRQELDKLRNTGHTPTVAAFNLYNQTQQSAQNVSNVLGKMYDVGKITKNFTSFTPTEQIATLQATSKVQSESKGLNYTFDLLEGKQKEDSSKYSFFTSNKAYQPKRLQDLSGLINYLETKLFKNLPPEIDKLAQEYLQFLNELKTSLKNLYENNATIPQELIAQRDKISKLTTPLNEAFVNQLREKQSLESTDTSNLSAKEKYKLQARLSRINSRLNLPLPFTQIPSGNVQGGYDASAISKLDFSKSIAGNFSASYKNLQKAIKSGNLELATELANGIKQGANRAQEEIKAYRQSLGVNAKMGTPTGDRLSQTQAQISRINNLAEKAAKKANLQTVGADVNKGFVQGIETSSETVAQAGEQTAAELTNAVKLALGIQSPSKVFKRIGEEVVAGFDRGLDAFDNSHENFKSTIYDFIGTGLRLKVLSGAFNFLKEYAPMLIETATAFEQLGVKLQFAVGGIEQAKNKFSELKAESKELGTNFQDNVSGFANLAASTKDTPLQGYATDLINKAVSEASTVRQLDRQSVHNVRLGIEQVANKGVVQREELVGQISERLTGTLPVAARAMNQSLPQFNQSTRRGLASEDFLPKFAQQLSAESAIALSSALESTTAKVNRFENSVTELQATLGRPLLDARNLGLSIVTPILENLTKLAPSLSLLMLTLALTIANKTIRSFVDFGIRAGILNTAFGTLRGTLRLLLPELIKFGTQFVGLTIAIELVQALQRAFSDASGEIKAFGEQSERSLNKLKDVIAEQSKLKPAERFTKDEELNSLLRDNEGKSYLKESAIGQGVLGFLPDKYDSKRDNFGTLLGFSVRGAVQEVESLFGNYSKKAKDDRLYNSGNVSNVSSETIQIANNQLNDSFAKLAQIDKALEKLQLKRRALVLNNPDDTKGLKEIQRQEQDILKSREKIVKVTGGIQGQTAQNIEALKKTIEELNRVAQIPSEYQSQYRAQADKLQESLKQAEQSQIDLNRAIKGSADAYTLFGRRVDNVLASIADASTARGLSTNVYKQQLNVSQQSGTITPEQNSFISQQVDVLAMQGEFKKLSESIIEISALINERADVLADHRVNQSTGEAELSNLSERLNDAPNDKLVIDKVIELKKLQKQAFELSNNITQQQAQLTQSLYETGKAIADFYREITNETQQLVVDTAQVKNTIALNSAKTKLKTALLGQQDNFVTTYVDSLVSLIEQLNQPLQQALQAQGQLIQNAQGTQNKLLQSQQLSRSNPYLVQGNVPEYGANADTGFNFKTPIQRRSYSIVEDVRGQNQTVNTYDDLEVHHPSRGNQGREGGRNYQNIRGRLEEINAQGLIKKDFVLLGGNGNRVEQPSPVNGRVSAISTARGRVEISDSNGNLIGALEHLTNILVKVGDVVQYGQTVGTQGGKGQKRQYGVHTHVEGSEATLRNYVRDLKDGMFDLPAQTPTQVVQYKQKGISIDATGLTAKGKQYAELSQNPKVQAFLKAIGIAEVGAELINQGKGYGKQIGGNYNTEEFSNPERLTSIPARLPGRPGTAFGRYQLHQQDFDWAKQELGVKNLSPQNQDIIGVQRLMFRGAIEPLLKGDLQTAIKKAGNEFTSLQGSKYDGVGINKTTQGGKLGAFVANYNRFLGSNSAPSAQTSASNTASTNGINLQYQSQYQQQIEQANKQILDNSQQQVKNIQDQLASSNQLANLEAKLTKNRAENQFEQGLKDSESSARNAKRRLEDLNAQNGYDTPQKQTQQQIIQTEREFYDMNDGLVKQLRELESARNTLQASKEIISKGGFPGAEQLKDQLPMIDNGLIRLDETINTVRSVLDKSSKAREARLKDIQAKAKVDQQRRDKESNIEIRKQKVQDLRNQADIAEQASAGNPGNLSRGDALQLRNQANQLEAFINLDEQIMQLEQLERSGERTTEQVVKLRREYELLANQKIEQGNIEYERNLAERLLKIDERNLAIDAKRANFEKEHSDLLAQDAELFMQAKPFNFSAGNPIEIKYKGDLKSLEIELKQLTLDARRFALEQKLTKEETDELIDGITRLNSLKLGNLQQQFRNNADEQARSVLANQRSIEGKEIEIKSGLFDAKSETYNQFGLGLLAARETKKASQMRLELEFNNQIAELTEFARVTGMSADKTEMLRTNIEELNKIKLDNLNNQFNPWVEVANSGITGLEGSIKGLLDGTMSLGDAFLNVGATIADTLTKLAAQWATNEIVNALFGNKFKQAQTPNFGIMDGIFGGSGASNPLGFFGSLFGMAQGGEVASVNHADLRQRPDSIGSALRKEGSNSVLAALTPGEEVLNLKEARVYRKMFPSGIGVLNFNQGGTVPGKINVSETVKNFGKTTNINIPVTLNGESNATGKENQISQALRAVVVAELKRQQEPGGLFS